MLRALRTYSIYSHIQYDLVVDEHVLMIAGQRESRLLKISWKVEVWIKND